jgi:hypothetical protein
MMLSCAWVNYLNIKAKSTRTYIKVKMTLTKVFTVEIPGRSQVT